MKLALDVEGYVMAKHPDSSTAGEWYPDDTELRLEMSDGRKVGSGRLRVSVDQPDGWEERAARQLDKRTGMWLPTGAPPQKRPIDEARERIREMRGNIPPSPTPEETSAILEDLVAVVVGGIDERPAARRRR